MFRGVLIVMVLLGLGAPARAADTATAPDTNTATENAGYLTYSEPHPLEEVNIWGALARSVVALGLVLSLMGGAVLFLRRYMPSVAGGSTLNPVRVIGRVGLGPKQAIVLLQLPGRILVVGSAGGQLTTLAEITDPKDMAQLLQAAPGLPGAAGAAFGGVFKRYLSDTDPAAAHRVSPRPAESLDAIRRQIANLRALGRTEAK